MYCLRAVLLFDAGFVMSNHPRLRVYSLSRVSTTDWLTENSGLTFSLANGASYTDKPIPHFTHSGTGYQLLAALGPAFSIEDYIWYQLPNGDVFAGSATHGMFAGKAVTIPDEFSQGAAAGDSMKVALVPSLRPGVVVNEKRVNNIRLHNDEMTLTWAAASGVATAKSPIVRQIENAYPELASGQHLPKFARVEAPAEAVTSGNIADPFRPRYAVDLQLLDADGKPAAGTPVYPAVPLPVPMAGNDSGMFQFPPPGTLVEVAFTDGRPDKPFIRQTLAQGNSLPDIKPGEQLQQQRDGVSQRVTVAGDWERQTDQTIRETSMSRVINADDETRALFARETTVQATDKTTVLGTASLMAGAIQQVAIGDYALASGGNLVTSVAKDASLHAGGSLTEKIAQLRQSIAGVRQEIIAPVVWVGSASVNVMQLMLDTLDVVQQLAEQTARHTYSGTGAPQNASAISATGTSAAQLQTKYKPVIG